MEVHASKRKLAPRSTPLRDGRNFLFSWPELWPNSKSSNGSQLALQLFLGDTSSHAVFSSRHYWCTVRAVGPSEQQFAGQKKVAIVSVVPEIDPSGENPQLWYPSHAVSSEGRHIDGIIGVPVSAPLRELTAALGIP